MAISEVCPYLKRNGGRYICGVKHEEVTPRLVESFYSDKFTARFRNCQIADHVGEGYLNCHIFAKQHWAELNKLIAKEVAGMLTRS